MRKFPYRRAAEVALVALFGTCVYRAITQSIVYDEALTWQLYILGPVANIFHHFDANHHFLNTVLMRLSTGLFGVSEWSMRIPALCGAALYFLACYRLARIAFGDGFTMLLAVAVATWNPLVLDFMVAARGYGLALALWMWAAAVLVEAFSRRVFPPPQLATAGTALGLSVTANLVLAAPVAALLGIVYLIRPRTALELAAGTPSGRKKPKRIAPAPGPAWGWLVFPMLGVGVLFLLTAPITEMRSSDFYTGARSIGESLLSLATSSLEHSGPLRFQLWVQFWVTVVGFGIGPLTVALGLLVGWKRRNVLLLVMAGTAGFSALALLGLHLVFGKPYPADRTGLYFLPMVLLALVGLAQALGRESDRSGSCRGVMRVASFASYAMAVLLALQFATEMNTRIFYVWEYDADTREIGDYLAAHRRADRGLVRVGASWQLQESLLYYAVARDWTWIEVRDKPQAGMDYYVLTKWDREPVELKLGLRDIYRGSASGSVLASR